MTPLPRIRRRHTEEQPTDSTKAVNEPAETPIAAELDTSVAPPSAAAVDPATMVAEAAAAVQATAQSDPAAAPADTRDEPEPRSSLRRFGAWASGRDVVEEAVPQHAAEEVAEAEVAAARPAAETPTPAPAGAPSTPARGPSSKDRGRMRRRIRYLRRARELGFRDLGGLMFDQYRFRSPNQELLGAKLAALHALDSERRALEHILGERREFDDLREPGISSCPNCGALHGSDAHFCERCGAPQNGTPAPVSAPEAEAAADTPPQA